MDNNTLYAILAVVVVLAIAAFFMGDRLKRMTVHLGNFFSGTAEGQGPGATVQRIVVEGNKNDTTAEGPGATIANSKVKGNENKIGAKTSS